MFKLIILKLLALNVKLTPNSSETLEKEVSVCLHSRYYELLLECYVARQKSQQM